MRRRKLTKKDIERWHLCRFEEAYSEFPSGVVHPGERPDFRVQGDRTVGIEITQLFREVPEGGQSLREIEQLRVMITDRAGDRFLTSGGPPVDVSVNFSEHAKLTKALIPSLAERLAALVQAKLPEPDQYVFVEYDWVNRDIFPEEIVCVRIARFSHRDWSVWQPTNAGYIPGIEPRHMQAAIDRKAPDVTTHRRTCEEVWLLVVADGFGISSTFTLSDVAQQHTYRSPFDRTIYFENFSKRAFDLKTQATDGGGGVG
jgi:hypothetical protein